MGRANAGKTTILQRVCKTTEAPEVIDGKGNKAGPRLYADHDEQHSYLNFCRSAFRSSKAHEKYVSRKLISPILTLLVSEVNMSSRTSSYFVATLDLSFTTLVASNLGKRMNLAK